MSSTTVPTTLLKFKPVRFVDLPGSMTTTSASRALVRSSFIAVYESLDALKKNILEDPQCENIVELLNEFGKSVVSSSAVPCHSRLIG